MDYLTDEKPNYSIHSEITFIKNCSLCAKIFSQEIEYRLHMKEHVRKNKYKCAQCGKILSSSNGLKKHLMTHEPDGTYQCIYCDMVFYRHVELKRHSKIHTGSTINYKCNLCEKGFSKMFHLDSHMRVHTKEKPFQCVFCEKAFTQNCNLIKHMTIHTGEKPHHCSECGKSFSNASVLLEHMKIHTGEKPFRCSFCDKIFSKKSHLDRHKLTHTGEKPYQCSHCELAFNQKAHLLRHMLVAHNGEDDIQVMLTEGKVLKLSCHKTKEKYKNKNNTKNTINQNKPKLFPLQENDNDDQECYVVIKNRKLSTEEILCNIEKDIEERKYIGMDVQSIKNERECVKISYDNKKLPREDKVEEDHLKNLLSENETSEESFNEVKPLCDAEDNILVKINEDYYLLEVENSEGIKMKMPSNVNGSNSNTEQENQLLEDVLNAIEMWLDDPTNTLNSCLNTQDSTYGRETLPTQPMVLDDSTNVYHSNNQNDTLEDNKFYLEWIKFE